MGLKRRLYKSGSSWAFWRWTFTPSGYLTRLFLVHTPWGGIMLHWINGPDPEPDPHNHPVTFLSHVLRGAYSEERFSPGVRDGHLWFEGRKNRVWFNFIRAERDIHRIVKVNPGTVTLVFYGRKRCEWGFFTREGWVYWKDYNAKYRARSDL